jgi:hypothetical protein
MLCCIKVLSLYQPGEFFGEDREGYPVYYDVTGNMDFKGIWNTMCLVASVAMLLLQGY